MIENSLTMKAKNVEEAIELGLKKLNLSKDQVDIRIISEGKKGFLGLGRQDAIVHLQAKNNQSFKEITQELEKQVGMSSQKERVSQDLSSSSTADYIRKNNQSEKQVQNEVKKDSDKSADQTIKNEIQESYHKEMPIDSLSEVTSETTKEVKEIKQDESLDKTEIKAKQTQNFEEACRYLEQIIKEYGADAKVQFHIKGNQVTFDIDTDKSGLVIGRHGKIINSLQTLVQIFIHNKDRRRLSVLLNVGDYRDRRLNVLEQIAERTADKVLKTKQTIILDPLPAYERKQIHAYLSKVDHIATHSEGKDPNRYLVVDYVSDSKLS